MKDSKYEIVWLTYSAESKYGKLFEIEDEYTLPWLIRHDKIESKELPPEYYLLMGIMLGYEPIKEESELNKPVVLNALIYLSNFFKATTFEYFLLNNCSHIGCEFGVDARMKALFNCSYFLENSCKLKSDLVVCIWQYLRTTIGEKNNTKYLKAIHAAVSGIDILNIKEEAIPAVLLSDYLSSKVLTYSTINDVDFEVLVKIFEDEDLFIDEFTAIRDEEVTTPDEAIYFMNGYFNMLCAKK